MQIKKFINYISIGLILLGIILFTYFNILQKTTNIDQEINKKKYSPPDTTEISVEPTPKIEPNLYIRPIDWSGLVTTAGGILLWVLRNFFDNKRKKSKLNNKNHVIFSVIENLKIMYLPLISLKTKGRTNMFRVLLKIQLGVFNDEIIKFLQLTKFDSIEDFHLKVRQLIYDIQKKQIEKWNYGGIPEIVILKYNKWIKDRMDLVITDINTISHYGLSSTSYKDALCMVLNSLSFMLRTLVTNDSLKALDNLDGELDKLTFKGQNLS